MNDETNRAKTTVHYPTDVAKAMQLLAQHKIVDADAVVEALASARADGASAELAVIVRWLKRHACPTPASWPALIEALAAGVHREREGG